MFQTSDLVKKRVYALTMDFFIVVVTNYFLMASFTNFLKTIFFYLPFRSQLFLISKLAVMSSVSLMTLTFAYFSLFYFVTNGHTMGKTMFGLKVRNSDNSEISLKQAIQRTLAYFVCAMFGSFLFALSFIRKDGKSLADVLSGTTVDYDKVIIEEKEKIGTEFQLTLLQTVSLESGSEDTTEQDEVEYFEQNKAS